MKNILVIGATGQIGSELTLELRKRYGNDHVVAGYIPSAMPQGELKSSGPSAIADVTDRQSIEVVVRQFKVDTIYNLAALLSVVAEPSRHGVEDWHRRAVECAGSGARIRLCRVYAELHRFVRREYSPRKDTAGYHSASAYHVRRNKSDYGIVK